MKKCVKQMLFFFPTILYFIWNRNKHKIYICDSPAYGNLGDQAIALSIYEWLCSKFPDRLVFEIYAFQWDYYSWFVKKFYRPSDIFCLTGGGNMGAEYPEAENLRRNVMKMFPDAKIIIFPQTIDYREDEKGLLELKKSQKIYNRCSNLTICAREKVSYDRMRQYYPDCRVLFTPDSVFLLHYDSLKQKRQGALTCFRNDREKKVPDTVQNKVETSLKKYFGVVENTDTCVREIILKKERKQAVFKKLQELEQYELMVTDRFHGMIFAVITGTPCIVLPSYNHKIKGEYEWIQNLKYICYIENLDDIQKIIQDFKESICPHIYQYNYMDDAFGVIYNAILR